MNDPVAAESADAQRDAAAPDRPAGGLVSLRSLASDAAVYGLASIVDRAIGFLLLPIVTAILSPRDYGIVSLFTTTGSLTFIVVSLCLHQSFFRHYTEAADEGHKRALINTTVTLAILYWAIAGGAAWLLAGRINELVFGVPGTALTHALIAVTLLETLDALAGNRLQADGRPWTLFWIRVGSSLVFRSVSVAAILAGAGAWGLIVADCCGRLVTSSLIMAIAFPRVRLRLERRLVRPVTSYGALLVPAMLSFTAMAVTDKYTIRALAENPLEQVGLYSVGERIAGIMHLANLAFILGWQRFAFRNMHEAEGPRVIARGLLIFAAAGGFMALSLSLLGDDITHWLIAAKFAGGIPVIVPLTIAAYFGGLASAAEIGLHKARRPGTISQVNVAAAALNVALNCYTIPRWGIVGAAYATLVSQAARLLVVWTASQRAFAMPLNYRRLATIWALGLAILFGGQTLGALGWIGATISQAVLVAASPLAAWALPIWSDKERQFVRAQLMKLWPLRRVAAA